MIDSGITGHWLDLNEPEIYHPGDWFNGFDPKGLHNEPDIHNLFAFMQIQSVYEGYVRHKLTQRPFMMSRSGAPGIQRYGATNWSNDIGSNYSSLATWNNVQMHMSMSGMDYYSSDLGGFSRSACSNGCDINQLYTQWVATGMMLTSWSTPHRQYLQLQRDFAGSHWEGGSQPGQHAASLRVESRQDLLAGIPRLSKW